MQHKPQKKALDSVALALSQQYQRDFSQYKLCKQLEKILYNITKDIKMIKLFNELELNDIHQILVYISKLSLLNFLEACFLQGVIKKLVMVDFKQEELFMHLTAAVYAIKQRMNTIVEIQPIFIALHQTVSSNFAEYFSVWIKLNAQHIKIQPSQLNKIFTCTYTPEFLVEENEGQVQGGSKGQEEQESNQEDDDTRTELPSQLNGIHTIFQPPQENNQFIEIRDDLSDFLDQEILGLPSLNNFRTDSMHIQNSNNDYFNNFYHAEY